MRTTIAISGRHRDRLQDLKRRWNLASLDDVIERLLAGPPETAQAHYQRHKAEVDEVLKRHRVQRLVAFGSRARGDARPDSDLDLAVVLPKDADLYDLVEVTEDLKDILGPNVDIVDWGGLRPPLRKTAQRDAVTLYGR